jgi:ParE toxin of type II toxin-antitoxin system, parDE
VRLVWTKDAIRDLDELAVYIAADSDRAAESVEASIHKEAKLLSRFPRSGRIGRALEPANAWWPEPLTFLFTASFPEGFAFSGSTTEQGDGRISFDPYRLRFPVTIGLAPEACRGRMRRCGQVEIYRFNRA